MPQPPDQSGTLSSCLLAGNLGQWEEATGKQVPASPKQAFLPAHPWQKLYEKAVKPGYKAKTPISCAGWERTSAEISGINFYVGW